MTTLAQNDLPPARGILKALAQHARQENDFGAYACLGTYAEVTAPGRIAVGDTVVID